MVSSTTATKPDRMPVNVHVPNPDSNQSEKVVDRDLFLSVQEVQRRVGFPRVWYLVLVDGTHVRNAHGLILPKRGANGSKD
eukprot:scaffold8927_cov176-Amphora_coffeaeformis.AAC.6